METTNFQIPELSKADKVKDWIRRADEDFGAAKLIQGHVPEYQYTVCFHCQQAADKYIRAFLTYHDAEVTDNVQLAFLLDKASKLCQLPKELYQDAEEMDYLVIKFRYPLDLLSSMELDFENLMKMVTHFREFFVKQIS